MLAFPKPTPKVKPPKIGFGRRQYVAPPPAPVTRGRGGVMAQYADAPPGPTQAKTKAKRCPALLEMANGRPCLLHIPGVCNGRTDTTVACHSGLSIHGKAGARKADDCYSSFGCAACHSWLDQGPAPRAVKEAAFMAAHLRQVIEWRRVMQDPTEPDRFRRAARWALDELNAMPTGPMP